ncbi:type II toxin-antitoxin system MqsA family antitoxin [Rouxiella badensis]|uniref:type II TA system antitoxin MqsA family protein n=1 Tax=Rouxiella badensis TaxID=1646377 RepID=UPI001D15E379|nr:type II TA system antitoxin MqsA family protein [Rouxiella badensis]MCC3742553.1 type II toxin-antitoxin system MqsA family antitoxin [Rouxiella badensis]
MKCSVCGGAELVSGTQKIPYAFRGHKTHIEAEGDHCPACGEVIMDREQSNAYQAKVKAFKAQIIAVTIEPAFIMSVRKKLALTQKEASEIFGGGVNAFSRYEKGIAQPHPSTIKLLQVLDHHPELLNEIRN